MGAGIISTTNKYAIGKVLMRNAKFSDSQMKIINISNYVL